MSTAEKMRQETRARQYGRGYPRAAIGHIPFPGFRSQQQVRNAERRDNLIAAQSPARAVEYGFDPEAVRP